MPSGIMWSTLRNFIRTAMMAMSVSFAIPAAMAQAVDKLTVPLTDPARPSTVKAGVVHGSITLKGYNGTEVTVEARLRATDAGAQEEKMKRIPIATTGLSAQERNNTVEIEVGSSLDRIVDLSIMVPFRTSVILASSYDGDISVTGIEGDLEVTASGGAVTLKNVAGTAVAHALKGKLLAQFDRVNPQKPMAFSSLSGDLDLTFPPDIKATLSISSNRGDVFTDFDVEIQPSEGGQPGKGTKGTDGKYRVEVDRSVRAAINGGGQQIQVKTYSGRIYIRKSGHSD